MDTDKPFDASEVHMCEDKSSPRTAWRTSSLVYALRSSVSYGTDAPYESVESRLDVFREAAAALTERGMDASSLVRYGLLPEIVGSLMALLTARQLLSSSDADREPAALGAIDLDGWARALELPAASSAELVEDMEGAKSFLADLATKFPRLVTWLTRAPLEDLVALRRPEDGRLLEPAVAPPDEMLVRQYRWLVDRFSTTFLGEWVTSSLHHEYRWSNRYDPVLIPESLMSDRAVDPVALNSEIARRAAIPEIDHFKGPDPHLLYLKKMELHAVSLLKQARYRDAATLFEFSLNQNAQDAAAMNNLGFCMIPDRPREALFYLERAAELRYPEPAINTYNQMCCHLSLGQHQRALRMAAEYWDERFDDERVAATLWEWGDADGWMVVNDRDARQAIAETARRSAAVEGKKDLEEVWKTRGAALSGAARGN